MDPDQTAPLANSTDLDAILPEAEFHLGFYCLLKGAV